MSWQEVSKSWWERLAPIALLVVASLGLVLCVGGIIGAWVGRATLIPAAVEVTGTLERYLGLVDETLGQGLGLLDDAQRTVTPLKDAVVRLAQSSDRALAIELFDRTVGERLPARLRTLPATIANLRDSIVSFNQTLERVNRLPGVSVPTITDELAAVDARLAPLQAQVEEVVAAVRAIDGPRTIAAVDRTTAEVEAIRTRLMAMQARARATRDALTVLRERLPGWGTLAASGLTLALILFGAGQVSLIQRALEMRRPAAAPAPPAGT